jgi:hypothetical protein
MNGVWVVLSASALLGLATGLVFRVRAMGPVSLIVALGSAIALNRYGFGFTRGILTVVACLFVSQAAYFAATIFAQRRVEVASLVDGAVDDPPGGDGKRDIGGK